MPSNLFYMEHLYNCTIDSVEHKKKKKNKSQKQNKNCRNKEQKSNRSSVDVYSRMWKLDILFTSFLVVVVVSHYKEEKQLHYYMLSNIA